MSAPKFTAGPWEVRAGEVFQVGSGGPPLASYIGRGRGSRDHCSAAAEEQLANARLLAAAPDLYAALRTLIERVEHYAPAMAREGDLDDARAALAKARGEEVTRG